MGTSDTNRKTQAGRGGRARDLGSIGESRPTDAASLDRSGRVPAGPFATHKEEEIMLPLLVVGMLAGGPVAAQPVHTVTLDEAIERAVERVGPPEEVYHVASDHRGPGKGDTIATLVILSADAATTCVVLRNPDGREAGLWHLATGPRPSCTEVIVSRALGSAAILGTGHLLAHHGKGKSGRFIVRGILAGISVMVINNIYQASR